MCPHYATSAATKDLAFAARRTKVEKGIPHSMSDAQHSAADSCGCRYQQGTGHGTVLETPSGKGHLHAFQEREHSTIQIRSTIYFYYGGSFKQLAELLSGQQEALMPLLQLAAAFDNLSRFAQELPAALIPTRPIDSESIEKRCPEVDCHSPQQSLVDAHRNVIHKALVGNYNVALAMTCESNR